MLRFTARWLDNPYYGKEWPPAPLRLFQAMIAGVYTCQKQISEPVIKAFQYLELLSPPNIWASDSLDLETVVTSVPNNDGDSIFRLLKKGNDVGAFIMKSTLRSLRQRQPKEIPCVAVYDWQTDERAKEHYPALCKMATSVTAIGQGVDLAWVTVEMADNLPSVTGTHYQPGMTGKRAFQVPYPGVTKVLWERHSQYLNCINPDNGHVRGIKEPSHRLQNYYADQDIPEWRYGFFALKNPDDSDHNVSFDGCEGARIAGMIRHAIRCAGKQAGLSEGVLETMMGHGNDRGNGRIRVMPIANVGHPHADGRIRRVMLAAPASLGEMEWRTLLHRLTGVDLTPVDARESPVAMLTMLPHDDTIAGRHVISAKKWTTTTPAILPGFDSYRGKTRPEKILRRVLKLAGISEALVESATLEPAPKLNGSAFVSSYYVPEHLRRWPISHVTIEFNKAQSGPLFVGGGSGYGFGLMLPCKR